MALLSLYLAAGVRPVVLHVEHGVRGERSREDCAFVKRFAEENGLLFLSTAVDAPKYAREKGISVELACRELRYAFFDEQLQKKAIDVVALAHHADDNAETILMHVFRGTGLKGLRGIVDRPGYIHPLISYSRREIDEYVEKNGIPFVEDETNRDTEYDRNFVRQELLPLVKTRYPEVVASLNTLAKNAEQDYDYLLSQTIPHKTVKDGIVIKDAFSAPEAIVRYSIKSALFSIGITKDLERTHLDAIVALKEKENNSSCDLPFGYVAEKFDSDLYVVKKRTEIFSEVPFDAGKRYDFRGYSYRFERGDRMIPHLTVDPKKVAGCVVRTKREGDLFTKVNGKRKLLSDFLNEKKMQKHDKDALLVLAKNNVVYAVLGLEVADDAKAEQDYLWIKKENTDL